MTTNSYRFVGEHADSLANGRPVEPGEFVELSTEETADNKSLVEDGKLVLLAGKTTSTKEGSN